MAFLDRNSGVLDTNPPLEGCNASRIGLVRRVRRRRAKLLQGFARARRGGVGGSPESLVRSDGSSVRTVGLRALWCNARDARAVPPRGPCTARGGVGRDGHRRLVARSGCSIRVCRDCRSGQCGLSERVRRLRRLRQLVSRLRVGRFRVPRPRKCEGGTKTRARRLLDESLSWRGGFFSLSLSLPTPSPSYFPYSSGTPSLLFL